MIVQNVTVVSLENIPLVNILVEENSIENSFEYLEFCVCETLCSSKKITKSFFSIRNIYAYISAPNKIQLVHLSLFFFLLFCTSQMKVIQNAH